MNRSFFQRWAGRESDNRSSQTAAYQNEHGFITGVSLLQLLGVFVVALSAYFLIGGAQPASAIDVAWTGNGASGGTCDDVGEFDDLDPGPGEQGWLFILTSPEDDDWTLNATFSDGAQSVAGEQQGMNGSIHFIVYTEADATLLSATATNGTSLSVLTVSHCELGEVAEEQTLTVNKVCEGTDEGEFEIFIDDVSQGTIGCGESTGAIDVDPDTFVVSEDVLSGGPFTTTFGGDCDASGNVDVAAGEDAVCTITNSVEEQDQTLTVNKVCEGTDEGEFEIFIDADGFLVGCGESTGAQPVDAGMHTVDEDVLSGGPFTTVIGGDCDASGNVDVAAGEDAVCTITNTVDEEIIQTLTVNKVCEGTDEGEFEIFIDAEGFLVGCGESTGAQSVIAGMHTVDEDVLSGGPFTTVIGGDCDASGNVDVAAGEDAVCTITNSVEEQDQTLTVNKVCEGTDEGEFEIFIDDVSEGQIGCGESTGALGVDPGTYAVDEEIVSGGPFTTTFGGDCDAAGTVDVAEGEDAVCTVTNTFAGGGVAEVPTPTATPTETTPAGPAAVISPSPTVAPTATPTTETAVSEVQGAVATPEEGEVSAVSSDVAPTQVSEVAGVTSLPSTGSGGLLSDEGPTPWFILASVAILAALAGATLLLARDRR